MKRNKLAKFSDETAQLLLELIEEAGLREFDIDKWLMKLTKEFIYELEKEIGHLKPGDIVYLRDNPALDKALKDFERYRWDRLMEYAWIMMNVCEESMYKTYRTTMLETYRIFAPAFNYNLENKIKQVNIQITDTYFTNSKIKIPWCQDGKIYSERIYANVANFQSKLNFVLEEGLKKGKGYDWMVQAWRKLSGTSAYEAARLIKTETVAMWSLATKETYLDMGIEYVEIVGDAACGQICTDFVGEVIPLADAELGDELPPYHPNCACEYIAYQE